MNLMSESSTCAQGVTYREELLCYLIDFTNFLFQIACCFRVGHNKESNRLKINHLLHMKANQYRLNFRSALSE